MQESEKLVRVFYDSTAPGHRERLCAIQAPDVVYDLPEGMPVGAGQFQGFQDIVDRFLVNFYGAFDVRFRADEYITSGDQCVVLGRIQGKARKSGAPVDVPFAHVWTVGDGRLQRLRAFTDTATMARALGK
ncbi:MAG TPA: nuclear transport factor 2 family protein [Candidatus Binatia bacterium]|jgi:ketosteroid isomerase-like protein